MASSVWTCFLDDAWNPLLAAPSFACRKCTVYRELSTNLSRSAIPKKATWDKRLEGGLTSSHSTVVAYRLGCTFSGFAASHRAWGSVTRASFPWREDTQCHDGRTGSRALPTWDPSDMQNQFFNPAPSSTLRQLGCVHRKALSLLKPSQPIVGGHFSLQNPCSTLRFSNYKESNTRTVTLIFKLRAPGICSVSQSWDWNLRPMLLEQPVSPTRNDGSFPKLLGVMKHMLKAWLQVYSTFKQNI